MTDTSALYEPPIYTFRVRLLDGGYAPPNARDIWREIEVAANQVLAELGDAIPLAFDFDLEHMWAFYLTGRAWDEEGAYNIDDPEVDAVAIRDLPLPGEAGRKEFLYIFDFGDEWHFGIRLVRTSPAVDLAADYPRVVASHGEAPPQYPGAAAWEEEWDEELDDADREEGDDALPEER
ncbi:MAG: hypothetical protein QJR03_13595 [Sphaerobacter sp.]|nr:hypothetical protein [Sphaerobacter sp.]